jgi:type II secretory pathway pseudopilin PulG
MELLVVIVIIAVLAGLLAPQISEMLNERDRLKTMELMTKLQTAISSFETEYNRLPVDAASSASGEDTEVLTDGSTPLVDTLMGLPPEDGGANWNPKGVPYAEFRPAQNGRHGVDVSSRPHRLLDPWGNPFHLVFDTNGDQRVMNPDAQNQDPRIAQPGGRPAGGFLSTRVAIFSRGRDGMPHTGDDIALWRP